MPSTLFEEQHTPLNLLPPAFFVTACPVSPDSHKSGTNVWKDFVLCYVCKQAHKRTYTIVSYPENLVLSVLPLLTIRRGVEAIMHLQAHELSSVRAHVYILCLSTDCTIAATT